MTTIKPWYPTLETSKLFSEHQNPTLTNEPPLSIRLASEDTAPLQGTKDLSDADSLEDVIAASYGPAGAMVPAVESDKFKV